MKAGRELDVLIAEKVMGEKNDGNLHLWVPRYSISIEAAWDVVEKFRGWRFELIALREPAKNDWSQFMVTLSGPIDVAIVGTADTAPLAICIAALRAKGV